MAWIAIAIGGLASMTARALWPSLAALLMCAAMAGGGQITVARAASDPPPASIDWKADAERPWQEEWSTFSCEGDRRFARVSAPVAQGAWAYGFELKDGDDSYGERCELTQGNPTRPGFPVFEEGEERWISWQIYLPDDFPLDAPEWNVVNQWKQRGDLGTPAISMQVRGGRFHLKTSDSNGDSCCTITRWTGPARRNRWIELTLHARFSPDPATGFIELFGDLDGAGQRLLMSAIATHTMKRDDAGDAVSSHARIGPYRDEEIDGTTHVYYDDYTVSASPPAELRPPVAPAPSPVARDAARIRISRRSLRPRAGVLALRIACPSSDSRRPPGRVTLRTTRRVEWRGRRRKARLGGARFRCNADRATIVRIRVPTRLLRRLGSVRVEARAVVSDGTGGTSRARSRFMIRAAGR